jgi:hypothetical protein
MQLRFSGAAFVFVLAVFAQGQESTGLIPLTDFVEGQNYKGMPGGLYGRNSNVRPPAWERSLLSQTSQIVPRAPDGTPNPSGKIGLVTIGMSNTSQESNMFIRLANQSEVLSPPVTLVNGAQGGQDVRDWGSANLPIVWRTLNQRVQQAGLTPNQVQAVWIKQAFARPEQYGDYAQHLIRFTREMSIVIERLKQTFPNLKVAYLSSRTYGGYGETRLNPEPYAYEYAFGVSRLIEMQALRGQLNWDETKGEVKAPILAWGPYLWADGENPRKDGLVWLREDFADDGTHPSSSGALKVARMLLQFFRSDTSTTWFRR